MDPNATLEQIRDLATDILWDAAAGDDSRSDDAIELAELVHALDVWLSGGGFRPREWIS